jgi:peptidoglycan/LPS O-acetylase OafA/YrhL
MQTTLDTALQASPPAAATPVKGKRLLGLDLFRVVAAFGVIVAHSLVSKPGDDWAPWSEATTQFRLFFRQFNIPFFLATAFFLLVPKLEERSAGAFFGPRWRRLIIPYLSWSALYLALRSGLYIITGQRDELAKMFADPIGLLFFGTAAVHLYFLPLLFFGEIVALGLVRLLGRRCADPAVVAVILIVAFGLTRFRNYDPHLDDLALWRYVPLQLADFVVRTFPYFALSLFLALPSIRRRVETMGVKAGIVFTAVGLACGYLSWRNLIPLPQTTIEVMIAFPLMLGSFAFSPLLKPSPILSVLTDCRFGIYLVHPLIIEAVELVYKRSPLRGQVVTLPRFLAFILLIFGLAWLFVYITMRSRILARLLYGVEAARGGKGTGTGRSTAGASPLSTGSGEKEGAGIAG